MCLPSAELSSETVSALTLPLLVGLVGFLASHVTRGKLGCPVIATAAAIRTKHWVPPDLRWLGLFVAWPGAFARISLFAGSNACAAVPTTVG